MKTKFSRRRVRKRKSNSSKSKMKIMWIIGIMIMAVVLGYLTARFVIGPILGYNADESPITAGNEKTEKTEKDASKADDNKKEETASSVSIDDGYALQFGVFSTKDAAESMVSKLKEKGIETQIIEEDDLYKVISPIIKTKDEALDKLEDIKEKEITDVFIASY